MDSPQQVQPYKKGDILWVKYRNKDWPAKVTAYYPKVKKISHIWFPLNRKSINSVFKADESKVRPFTEETTLPLDADPDLTESYNQAMRILHGATEEEIIQEHERYLEEFATTHQQKSTPKLKKSLTTMDVLKKTTTPRVTPKLIGKSKVSYSATAAASTVSDFEELPVPSKFVSGDTIIVDTKIGMWPGMFHSYVEDNPTQIRYTLFPRTDPVELLTGPLASLLHFPLDQIDASIMDFNGSDVLMQALLDARNYLHMLKQQTSEDGNKQQRQLVQKTPTSVKNMSGTSTKMNRNNSSLAMTKENVIKSKSFSASLEMSDKPAKTKAYAQARLSQKRSLTTSESSQRESAYQQKEISSSLSKKRVKTDNLSNNYRKVNGSKFESSSTSPPKQIPLNNERVPETTLKNQNEEKKPYEEEEEEPIMVQQPEEFFEEHKDVESDDEMDNVAETPEHKQNQKLRNFFKLIISEEAHAHMRNYWNQIAEEQSKKLENTEFYHLDFRTDGLLTFNETEKLVTEVQQWIKLVHKIPILSQLKELFYISKYVLPELCAFAISKQQGISMDDAKRIYQEKLKTNAGSINVASGSTSPSQAVNSKLDTLVMAANLMADKKNGNNIGHNGSEENSS